MGTTAILISCSGVTGKKARKPTNWVIDSKKKQKNWQFLRFAYSIQNVKKSFQWSQAVTTCHLAVVHKQPDGCHLRARDHFKMACPLCWLCMPSSACSSVLCDHCVHLKKQITDQGTGSLKLTLYQVITVTNHNYQTCKQRPHVAASTIFLLTPRGF